MWSRTSPSGSAALLLFGLSVIFVGLRPLPSTGEDGRPVGQEGFDGYLHNWLERKHSGR